MSKKLSKNTTTLSTKNSYSQALFELASENNSINDIEIQASSILELINKSFAESSVTSSQGLKPWNRDR